MAVVNMVFDLELIFIATIEANYSTIPPSFIHCFLKVRKGRQEHIVITEMTWLALNIARGHCRQMTKKATRKGGSKAQKEQELIRPVIRVVTSEYTSSVPSPLLYMILTVRTKFETMLNSHPSGCFCQTLARTALCPGLLVQTIATENRAFDEAMPALKATFG